MMDQAHHTFLLFPTKLESGNLNLPCQWLSAVVSSPKIELTTSYSSILFFMLFEKRSPGEGWIDGLPW
jgi:hypothetical protein